MRSQLLRKFLSKKANNNNIEKSDIENNLGFLLFAVKQFCNNNNCQHLIEDMIQAGSLGLLEACKKFDKNRGTKFTTYAINWIKAFMYDELNKQNIIYLPDNKILEGVKHTEVISFNRECQNKDYDSNNILDSYALPEVKENYDVVKLSFIRLIQETLFSKINNLLGDFEKKVIELKYYKNYSFSEIGNELGFTKQNANVYEKLAIKKLRADKEIQNLYPLYQDLCYN
jgi:RNA polymerase sigma factor (sigma-70 family)